MGICIIHEVIQLLIQIVKLHEKIIENETLWMQRDEKRRDQSEKFVGKDQSLMEE